MKKVIILIIFSLSLLIYTNQNSIQQKKDNILTIQQDKTDLILEHGLGINQITKTKNTIEMYRDFLEGKISVEGIDINLISIPTGEPNKRYETKYAFFDSNGDEIPELHVRGGHYYCIFTIKDNNLILWKSFSPNPPFYALNNGAFICRKLGAAPRHDNYGYVILNYSGDEIYNLNFSKYDEDGDGIYGINDEYLFNWVNVSKEQWEELTKQYLYVDNMEIEQIRNEISWNVLYKQQN